MSYYNSPVISHTLFIYTGIIYFMYITRWRVMRMKMNKLKCWLFGHRWTQHTYGSGITYTGKHCWRCKKGLEGYTSAHRYESLMKQKGPY